MFWNIWWYQPSDTPRYRRIKSYASWPLIRGNSMLKFTHVNFQANQNTKLTQSPQCKTSRGGPRATPIFKRPVCIVHISLKHACLMGLCIILMRKLIPLMWFLWLVCEFLVHWYYQLTHIPQVHFIDTRAIVKYISIPAKYILGVLSIWLPNLTYLA